MSGLVFSVFVPTAEYERKLIFPAVEGGVSRGPAGEPLIRLKVPPAGSRGRTPGSPPPDLPMEKVLEEALRKLNIERVVWQIDKLGHFYQVMFPVAKGDECENCLHALTQLGIGRKLQSVISVMPCTVVHQAGSEELLVPELENETNDSKAWNNFVQSIRSKLTVKQVVDGVRGGAECSFDYLLLVLTADMVAAVGLVENNSVNIVAAMLISPLMGPIMAGTFGTVIADRKLQRIGIRSELIGLFISLIFGFIFGLLVGTTESPWGTGGDWPTEEMKGRGNSRSLWIGILWALPSGTGVALALLQGNAGPLIGVAISASLLPPAVNCGMMWGLAIIHEAYDNIKMPYLRGQSENGTSSAFIPFYHKHYSNELAAMGIISFCLTLINICCIFITAVIVLKIKEVAAPYTSSADLRRFWEVDIRSARDTNRHTLAQNRNERDLRKELNQIPQEELESTVGAALREALDDDTFRKVKRCSYAQSDLTNLLGLKNTPVEGLVSGSGTLQGDKANLSDPAIVDYVIQALLTYQAGASTNNPSSSANQPNLLNRFRPLSRSLRQGSFRKGGGSGGKSSARNSWLLTQLTSRGDPQGQNGNDSSQNSNHLLPTILEGGSPSSPQPRPFLLPQRSQSDNTLNSTTQNGTSF